MDAIPVVLVAAAPRTLPVSAYAIHDLVSSVSLVGAERSGGSRCLSPEEGGKEGRRGAFSFFFSAAAANSSSQS